MNVYSNAGGTVQFIEFSGDADDQDEWAGHTLTSTDGVTTHMYTFPANLPGAATLHKSVLVATQGFSELGLVTSDYIIPDGFLFTGSGDSMTQAQRLEIAANSDVNATNINLAGLQQTGVEFV